MSFEDMFKPYSPETKGDLEEYLRECERENVDNLFYGQEFFSEIRDKGLMIPGATWIRVNMSPIPDIGYFVNSNYLLESEGHGQQNMSLMGAKKGVYNPNEALKGQVWSILGLNLWDKPSQ